MHDNELWQVFSDNGSPVQSDGRDSSSFKNDPSLIMGNSHIWFWKKSEAGVDILLQQRSLTKSSKPGWFHISAGGHINVGESALEAAIRETKEEMGLDVDPNKLHFSFSTRIIGRAPNDIVTVYLYELQGDEEFTYIDGEVESYEWRTLDDFKAIALDPEIHNLINQGRLYFDSLVNSVEYVSTGKNTLL